MRNGHSLKPESATRLADPRRLAGDRERSKTWLQSAKVGAFRSSGARKQSLLSFFSPQPCPRAEAPKPKRKPAPDTEKANGSVPPKKKHKRVVKDAPKAVAYDQLRREKNRVGYVVGEAVEG